MNLDCMAYESYVGSIPSVYEIQQCANHNAEY